ncbi:NUDIX domain-containing protein [uncultured Rothia sp.]|uniref:NUDIX domain-containing protein n=1 Tax=uncultured Rothia sp. TaxID=316088 RepID=UPI0032163541
MKKQINVVGAVLLQNGKILCAQRSEHMSLPLLWEFPGGKIEAGETPQEALKRELEEELTIEAEVGE